MTLFERAAILRRFAPLALALFAVPFANAMTMSGEYGSCPMTREASGTSWQPQSTPMEGVHVMRGDWMIMLHGYADGIYDRQGGPRGAEKGFSESMLMGMAQLRCGGERSACAPWARSIPRWDRAATPFCSRPARPPTAERL